MESRNSACVCNLCAGRPAKCESYALTLTIAKLLFITEYQWAEWDRQMQIHGFRVHGFGHSLGVSGFMCTINPGMGGMILSARASPLLCLFSSTRLNGGLHVFGILKEPVSQETGSFGLNKCSLRLVS